MEQSLLKVVVFVLPVAWHGTPREKLRAADDV